MATLPGDVEDRDAGARERARAGSSRRAPGAAALEREAFIAFPYGLLVLDRSGRIVSRNRAAERMTDQSGLADGDLTCCALLGCRRPETVLAHGCLTELALARDGMLPEVRVDLHAPGGRVAVWVGGGAVGEQRERVVLQLRPGLEHDRRQRTDPHWMTGPKLRIRTLGRTVLEAAEGQIGGAWLDQRTGQLLKYLIAERRRSVTIDEIGETLWTNAEFAVGASVRYYVHALRRRLEPERGPREPSAFIFTGAGGYRLNLARIELDVDEFDAGVEAGMVAVKSDPAAAIERLGQALAVYRGEFLADVPYAEWADAERQRLHAVACDGLRVLAELLIRSHQLADASDCQERLAALQPYDQQVHRQLMELDIIQGRPSDAVRRYAALRSRTRRTFGHDPDFTPAELVQSRPRA